MTMNPYFGRRSNPVPSSLNLYLTAESASSTNVVPVFRVASVPAAVVEFGSCSIHAKFVIARNEESGRAMLAENVAPYLRADSLSASIRTARRKSVRRAEPRGRTPLQKIFARNIHARENSCSSLHIGESAKPSATVKPFDFAGITVSVAPGSRSNSPIFRQYPVPAA